MQFIEKINTKKVPVSKSVLVTFHVAVLKCPGNSNSGEKAFILAKTLRGQSLMAGKLVAEARQHITSIVRKQRMMNFGV